VSFLTTSVEQDSCVPSYPQGNGSDSYFEVPTNNSVKDCFLRRFSSSASMNWLIRLHVFKFCFTGQVGSRGNASKILVFGKSPFRIAVAILIFPGVLSPSRQIPGSYRNSGHWCYFSCPSHFITHHRPIIWRYIINTGPALLVGRSRDRFPVVSLDFSVTYSFRPYHGPGVDLASSENEYQEHFLG